MFNVYLELSGDVVSPVASVLVSCKHTTDEFDSLSLEMGGYVTVSKNLCVCNISKY